MPRLALILLPLLMALPLRAEVAPAEVTRSLGDPVSLGQASYGFLGLPLYDATLFTSGGGQFDWRKPLALQLVYARALTGETIIDSTLSELDRIEGAMPDHDDLRRKLGTCFRDVRKGDRYVAIAPGAAEVSFWLNGEKTCELRHDRARERILAIWLSEESRAPRQARALRGQR